jgi:hypothetical protein
MWTSNKIGCEVDTFWTTYRSSPPNYGPAIGDNIYADHTENIRCYNRPDHSDIPATDSITFRVKNRMDQLDKPSESAFNTTCRGLTSYGALSEKRTSTYLPNEKGVVSGAGTIIGSLNLNGDTDVTLRLEKKRLGGLWWDEVGANNSPGNTKLVSGQYGDGTYRWRVTSAGGESSFALCSLFP